MSDFVETYENVKSIWRIIRSKTTSPAARRDAAKRLDELTKSMSQSERDALGWLYLTDSHEWDDA